MISFFISSTEVRLIKKWRPINGRYPDSLEQLRNEDEMINISDPLLVSKMSRHSNVNFQYKKINEKYTLFSIGIDGIPNTSDDIYPSMLHSDTSKFGLIQK